MGTLGLWGWAGGAWCWGQPGDITGDTREGTLEWNAFLWEPWGCGAGQGVSSIGGILGASQGTHGMGGHQGRDAGVGGNKERMHSYGNPGAVGLGRGCLALGTSWGHHWGHMGWGDTREGMLEWGSTGMECIPMGILGLWGWAGDPWCWGQPGDMAGDTREGTLEWNAFLWEPWGWAGGAWCWGHPGGITGDTWDGGTPEWGSTRKECIPMGTLGLWGWAGAAWQWGHPGDMAGDTWDGGTPGKGHRSGGQQGGGKFLWEYRGCGAGWGLPGVGGSLGT